MLLVWLVLVWCRVVGVVCWLVMCWCGDVKLCDGCVCVIWCVLVCVIICDWYIAIVLEL